MMKRGFTLLEVLLAVSVMATGVLSVVILYSMGFREARQSREDVVSAVYADAVLSPLVNALSATNLAWSSFNMIENSPGDNGWAEYYALDGQIYSDADSLRKAKYAFDSVMSRVPGDVKKSSESFLSTAQWGLSAGLVVMHEKNSPIVKIAFRACRNSGMLMSAPLYYTEVCFQGDATK